MIIQVLPLLCSSYATKDKDSRQLLVARVLVGKYTVGKHDYVRPPFLDDNTMYDSCVDNTENPKIYVIFSNEQAYPEYIIDYVKLS